MFEQQILRHKLSKSFDSIKAHDNEEEWVNKRNKNIQDFKRRMRNIELGQYEVDTQQYAYLYKQELTKFESEAFKTNSSYQMSRLNMLIHFVKTYVYHHTNIALRRIHYKESCLHVKLIRHDDRRHQSSPTKKIIDVYPIRLSFTY
jgi:hypothetical protein